MAVTDSRSFEYDVCFSFAGEDRAYVRQVAQILKARGVRVFYDEYKQVDMWGKDLYVHLDEIYQNTARYCVIFTSAHYAKKLWTNHERESAQARAIREHSEYLLPAIFDETKIPGLRPTIGYLDLRMITPAQLADMIIEKVGDLQTDNYLPPEPDRLFKRLKVRGKKSCYIAQNRAYDFFKALQRMSEEEREVIFLSFILGCPAELPHNTHVSIDLIRRVTGFAPTKIKRLVSGLGCLGFNISYRTDRDHVEEGAPKGKDNLMVIEWHDTSVDDDIFGNSTIVASEMIMGVVEDYCEECGMVKLRKLNFAQLATATTTTDCLPLPIE